MAESTLNSQFYWENIVIKVEDEVFCVPRYEFVQSSEVFADMFQLPSGPAANREGRDREHPIFLEGYKKADFVCLLKVMYPMASSLIGGTGTKLDLSLEKHEWVSVLKLSTMWNMVKIREYAIRWLSSEVSLSPTEKILLAKAHKVAAWLEEGVASLVNGDPKLTLEELATLGWETAARILWIMKAISLEAQNTLRFRMGDIKCSICMSSSSLVNGNHNCASCRLDLPADAELTFPGIGSAQRTTDRLVPLLGIQCQCTGLAFHSITLHCSACEGNYNQHSTVRITPKLSKEMIMEAFGEEIKHCQLHTLAA